MREQRYLAIPWFTNFRTYQRRQRALLFTYRYRDSRLVLQNYLELLTNKVLLLLQRNNGFGYMTWLNMKLHRSSHFFSNQWIKSQSSILSTITITINNSNQNSKSNNKANMKLSGGALALLAALAVSCEEASASNGSESIVVCNTFAKFFICTAHIIQWYSHT